MKNNESKTIMNTKYKEKWNYGLVAGIYVLLAGVWVVIAVDRMLNSTTIIAAMAAICAVGFLCRAVHEIAAYLKDRKYFHIKVLKSGSLRFWGDWFGRPMDNIHTVVSTEYLAKENKLILHFSEGETCTIYEPTGIVNEVEGFHIKDAAKVEWEWYAYGKEPSGKTLCRRIYTRKDNNAVLIESYGEPEQGVKVLHFHDLYALEIY